MQDKSMDYEKSKPSPAGHPLHELPVNLEGAARRDYGKPTAQVHKAADVEHAALEKYATSFGLSLALTCIFSALLVVLKELSPPVINWMKSLTTHHWITHGIFDVIVFVGFGLALTRVRIAADKVMGYIVGSVVVSGLIVAGFYLFFG